LLTCSFFWYSIGLLEDTYMRLWTTTMLAIEIGCNERSIRRICEQLSVPRLGVRYIIDDDWRVKILSISHGSQKGRPKK
jgi:hypothetical protein